MKPTITTLFSLIAVAILCAPVHGALVIRYDFDEASGNALNSGTAVGADASFVNAATRSATTPSGVGSSLDVLNGNNDHVITANAISELDNSTQATMTFWLYLPSDPANHDRVFAFQDAGRGISVLYDGGPSNGFNLRVRAGSGSGADEFKSTATFNAKNKWAFVAITVDLSGTTDEAKFYAGNETTLSVIQIGTTVTRSLDATDIGASPAPLTVGNWSFGIDKTAPSLIDDFRIYNTVLSKPELETIRLEGIAVPEPATLGLLGIGCLMMLGRSKRKF